YALYSTPGMRPKGIPGNVGVPGDCGPQSNPIPPSGTGSTRLRNCKYIERRRSSAAVGRRGSANPGGVALTRPDRLSPPEARSSVRPSSVVTSRLPPTTKPESNPAAAPPPTSHAITQIVTVTT